MIRFDLWEILIYFFDLYQKFKLIQIENYDPEDKLFIYLYQIINYFKVFAQFPANYIIVSVMVNCYFVFFYLIIAQSDFDYFIFRIIVFIEDIFHPAIAYQIVST